MRLSTNRWYCFCRFSARYGLVSDRRPPLYYHLSLHKSKLKLNLLQFKKKIDFFLKLILNFKIFPTVLDLCGIGGSFLCSAFICFLAIGWHLLLLVARNCYTKTTFIDIITHFYCNLKIIIFNSVFYAMFWGVDSKWRFPQETMPAILQLLKVKHLFTFNCH